MRNIIVKSLAKCENAIASWRRKLSATKPIAHSIDLPNDPGKWEDIYLTDVKPVTGVRDLVAKRISELTEAQDEILEAGCGSGELSAQLAHAGRSVILADFSDKILKRAARVFQASSLSAPKLINLDLTKKFPLETDSVDVVWSSGVLEHWTDEELIPIVAEMNRVSRKKVISLVPYAGSLFYRLGKHLLEKSHRWPYGREIPRFSLAGVFENAGCKTVFEEVIWTDWPPRFLAMYDSQLGNEALSWWESLPEDDPVKYKQGYLLLTVGVSSK